MANPRNATTSKGGSRFYTWRDENYWSVTTILNGGLPKPALINWAKKYTAEYAVEHMDSLNQLVSDDPAGAVEWLKGAAYRERDQKADIGSELHAAAEAYTLGQPWPKVSDDAVAKLEAFKAFLKECSPVFEASEASVYNRAEKYAGTLDGILGMLGESYILDTKSGKSVYPEVALQLAAYRRAEFIGLPDGSEAAMPQVDRAACLHLTDDDYELVDVDTSDDVYQTFLYVREVFRWQQERSKTVLRGPIRPGDGTQAVIAFGKMAAGDGGV